MGVSGWMFLLVPAHPGSPEQRAVKRLSVFIVVWWAAAKSVALNHKKWIGKERTKGKNHCQSVILTLLFYCLFAVGQSAVVVGPAMQLSWLLPSAAFCMSVLSVLLTYCHRIAYCDGRFVAVNWHVHEITSQCSSVGQALSKAKQSKVYGYCSSQSSLPHRYGNSHAIQDHTVLPATRQRRHSHLYPSWSWYSIKRPRRDARLSWPSWLVTYRDGILARRRSPIQVLTGPDVR